MSLKQFIKKMIPDKIVLMRDYKKVFGKKLNLKAPKTYNEKLQWLKLYYRNPLCTKLVDKYAVKNWVSERIGSQYVIPTLGVWKHFDDIDFEKLPNSFVLKCSHDSGGLFIVKDKSQMDLQIMKKTLNHCLKQNFYWASREWPYKNVPPRIIAEQYMEDDNGELNDYKFFCFNGKVKALFIASDRQNKNEETKFDFFDQSFNHLQIENGHPNASSPPKKPLMFEKMISIAEKLSKGFPHVRVDLYEIDSKVYFGEMTFFHWGGLVPFSPEKWDYIFGEWLSLPKKRYMID